MKGRRESCEGLGKGLSNQSYDSVEALGPECARCDKAATGTPEWLEHGKRGEEQWKIRSGGHDQMKWVLIDHGEELGSYSQCNRKLLRVRTRMS